MILSTETDGRVHITCPFEHEHTTESVESATTYWPAHTGGYAHPSIKCLHAHCEARRFEEYAEALGISPADDFDDIRGEPDGKVDILTLAVPEAERFIISNSLAFGKVPQIDNWICEDVIPRGAMGVLYGAPSAGKTFIIFDLIAAVARGIEWNGKETTKGRVLYVCAEGQNGFRNRIEAYRIANNLDVLDVEVMDGGPDLINKKDIKAFIEAIKASGRYELIVIDTYATCMSGDENSAQDVGKAIAHCKLIHRLTGAMVILVHHSPKTGGGARGHSSLKGACDMEMEVLRDEDRRMLTVTKMKDGGDDLSIGFRLEEIEIRVKPNGKPVTSCVVEYTDLKISNAKKGSRERLGTNEETVFAMIQDLWETAETWPDRNYIMTEMNKVHGTRKYNVQRAIDNLIERERVVDTRGILSIM
jgi:archaellum biogenesis ATPase FlaH